MSKQRPAARRYDVFLSHAVQDEPLATVIKQRLADFGLSAIAVSPPELRRSAKATEAIRRALVGSRAFVALLTSEYKTDPAFLLEFGAAWQQDIPIYVFMSGKDIGEVPAFLQDRPIRPLSDLSEVIAEITENRKPVGAGSAR